MDLHKFCHQAVEMFDLKKKNATNHIVTPSLWHRDLTCYWSVTHSTSVQRDPNKAENNAYLSFPLGSSSLKSQRVEMLKLCGSNEEGLEMETVIYSQF